ncbi:MAG: histidine triad nucleotide-binding protein [Proteobacteria bacterium]|nr:histidine triad nucleotide-binding protein [Pseudomonadota bacterium]
MDESIFTQILKKKIPGDIVYEDNDCFAIKDINPQAPIHLLIIPKKHIAKVSDASHEDRELLGSMLLASKKIAKKFDLNDNYRLVINNGAKAGQTVFHIHIHLLGGKSLSWSPG